MHELQYNFTEHTAVESYKALQGPVTGDTYQTGQALNTNPNSSFIIRLSDPNTVVWSQFYENFKFSLNTV